MQIERHRPPSCARLATPPTRWIVVVLSQIALIALLVGSAIHAFPSRAEVMTLRAHAECAVVEAHTDGCGPSPAGDDANPSYRTSAASGVVGLIANAQKSTVSNAGGEYWFFYVIVVVWIIVLVFLLVSFVATGDAVFIQIFFDVLTLGMSWILRLVFGIER